MFKLTIAEAEKVVYEGEAEILNVLTINGQIGVLSNHAPFVDIIRSCELTFTDDKGERQHLAVSGGWLFVWSKEVTVLVNASEFDFEINIEKAIELKEEAEAELQKENLDILQTVHAKARLEKAINRINIATRKK